MQETEDYAGCYLGIHNLWKNNKKEDFKKLLQERLAIAANPYKLCLVCIKLCPDLYKNNNSGMAANVVVELQSFLNRHKDKYADCLSETMQLEVFHISVKQKNTGMMRLLVKAYQLNEISDQLFPKLRVMVEQGQYKDVCTLAALLNLQEYFTTQELIIPLFCLDRLCLADEFLDRSKTHQKELMLFIDSVIGREPEAYRILEKFNITDVDRFKSSKVLSNIAARLLKRFKLDMSLCPHLYRRRSLGGLRYLFYKYYIEKGIQTTAFHSLVEDALHENPALKPDLMFLFCEYCDPRAAVPYVKKFDLKPEEIPEQINTAVLTFSSNSQCENAQSSMTLPEDECWDMDGAEEKYSLNVSKDHIIFVSTCQVFEQCMKELLKSPVVGLDSEWKPTFGIGNGEQVALIQFSTSSHIYLVDVVTLQPLLEPSHWVLMGRLFTDVNVIKLGYGIRGDFKAIAKLHPELMKALSRTLSVIDFDQKKAVLLEVKPEIFSYSPSSYKGLSDLVYRCFGKPLSKTDQFSNWANRPLTKSQELYAALDARCLVDIYDYLNTKAQELNIGDWQNLKREPSTKQKKQKHAKRADSSPDKATSIARRSQGPIAAKDFRVVCDTMLQGLAKKLRLCGIDAVALDNGQSPDDCIDFFEKEGRVVLSRGAAFNRLSKFIPTEFVCHVESERLQEQLLEVLKTFKVTIGKADIFTRCTKCNSCTYISVPSLVIRRLLETDWNLRCKVDEWVDCDGVRINLGSGCTETGVKVCLKKVTIEVVELVDVFKVCIQCGKCYWEGFHQHAALKSLQNNCGVYFDTNDILEHPAVNRRDNSGPSEVCQQYM